MNRTVLKSLKHNKKLTLIKLLVNKVLLYQGDQCDLNNYLCTEQNIRRIFRMESPLLSEALNDLENNNLKELQIKLMTRERNQIFNVFDKSMFIIFAHSMYLYHLMKNCIFSDDFKKMFNKKDEMELYILYKKYDELRQIDKKVIVKNSNDIVNWMYDAHRGLFSHCEYFYADTYNLYMCLKDIIDFTTYETFWKFAYYDKKILQDVHDSGINLLNNSYFVDMWEKEKNEPMMLFLNNNEYDLNSYFKYFLKMNNFDDELFEMAVIMHNNLQSSVENSNIIEHVYIKYLRHLIARPIQNIVMIAKISEHINFTENIVDSLFAGDNFYNYHSETIKILFSMALPSHKKLSIMIHQFVQNNRVDLLRAVIESKVDISSYKYSIDLLSISVSKNNSLIAKILVINKITSNDTKLAQYTATNKNFELFLFLQDNGLIPNDENSRNDIINLACKNGLIEYLQYYENQPNVFTTEHYESACISCSIDCIAFIDNHVNATDTKPYKALTKICVMLQNSQEENVNKLYNVLYRIINSVKHDDTLCYVLNKTYGVKLSYDQNNITNLNVIIWAIRLNLPSFLGDTIKLLDNDELCAAFDVYSEYPHCRMFSIMKQYGYNQIKYKTLPLCTSLLDVAKQGIRSNQPKLIIDHIASFSNDDLKELFELYYGLYKNLEHSRLYPILKQYGYNVEKILNN